MLKPGLGYVLARIALGAAVGLGVAMVGLAILVVCLEVAYAHGYRYDDLTLAYVSWAVLMVGPIVGGWWTWVRR